MTDIDKPPVVELLNRLLEQELAGVVRYIAQQAGELITLQGAYPSVEIGRLLDSHQHDWPAPYKSGGA